jgi:hypothetical protein
MVSQTVRRHTRNPLFAAKLCFARGDSPVSTSFGRAKHEKVRNRHENGESTGPGARRSVVLTVFAGLRHRQRTLESVVAIGIDAQPLGR